MIASLTARAARPCLIALLFTAVTLPASVRADVAVMVPPQTEQGAGSDIGDKAVDELTRLLKVQGFDVVSAGQAAAAAEAEQQRGAFSRAYDPLYCITPECANEYRKLFDATFAVQLKLSGKGVRASSVSVVLTESPQAFFTGSAPMEGRDARSAVRIAFETARSRQAEGAGPWLTVQGSPEASTVYLDGMEFGRVPFFKRHVEPGSHRIEVRAAGHTAEIREVTIPNEIDHVQRVQVELARVTEAPVAATTSSPSRRARASVRSPWDWVLGGALVAVGATHLGFGIYQKSRDGECAARRDGRCTELYGDRRGMSRENALIGFGAGVIGVGALVLGVGPLGRLQLRSGTDHASLHWSGEF